MIRFNLCPETVALSLSVTTAPTRLPDCLAVYTFVSIYFTDRAGVRTCVWSDWEKDRLRFLPSQDIYFYKFKVELN